MGPGPALAADLENGETVFQANCASCHAGGNNSIVPEKKIKKAELEKYLLAATRSSRSSPRSRMVKTPCRLLETSSAPMISKMSQIGSTARQTSGELRGLGFPCRMFLFLACVLCRGAQASIGLYTPIDF